MDLMRRRAAGELAELFGPGVLSIDRANRIHRFRAVAQRVLETAPPDERAWVEA
jgi:penicillin amidase